MENILKIEGVNANGYGIIPKLVMQDKRLTRDAKCIYAYFCSFAGTGSKAFPSVAKICDDLNYGSDDTFRKHFKLLVKYGYVKVEQQRAKKGSFAKNIYTLCTFPIAIEEIEKADNPEITTSSPSPDFKGTVEKEEINTVPQIYGDGKIPSRLNWDPMDLGTKSNSIKSNIKEEEKEEEKKINSKKENRLEKLSEDNSDDFLEEIKLFENYTGIELKGLIHKKTYIKWREEWGVSFELIMKAAELMCKLAKTPNLDYLEQILIDWRRQNISTPEGVDKVVNEHKKTKNSYKNNKSKGIRPNTSTFSDYEIYVPPQR